MSVRYTKDGMQTSKTLKQDRYKYSTANITKNIKDIVGSSNIVRMIHFDTIGSITTLTDKSTNSKDATLSLASSLLNPSTVGKLRILNFNGSGDYWDFVDSDDLSFGNGVTDSKFSIIMCASLNDTANRHLISKHDATTGNTKREFNIYIGTANQLTSLLVDDSSGGFIGRYGASIASLVNVYSTFIITYDGSSNVSGIKNYINGTQNDTTNLTSGIYTAMENKTALCGNYRISSAGAKELIGSAKYVFIAIISDELSQTQVTSIDSILRRYLSVL